MTPLSKNRYQQIRLLQSRKDRLKTGLTLLEGERLIADAFQSGCRIQQVLGTPDFWERKRELVHRLAAAGIQTFVVTEQQLRALAATENPAASLAVVAGPAWDANLLWDLAGRPDFLGLLAVGVQDPGNLGTLLRTLAAAGGQGAWLDPACAEAAAPKVLRASAGTVLRLPVAEDADPLAVLAECSRRNIQTLATVPKGGRSYTSLDMTPPTLLVLGTEGEGLPGAVVQACQHKAAIPMPGRTDSLNVAVAGAVLIYEALRQRRQLQAASREDERERTTG